jgi:beta-lactamase regulating signal transducer with metallopeptidase domain
MGIWASGAAGIGLYLIRDYRRLTRLVNACPTLTSRPALDLLHACCSQLRIKASVRLIVTDAVASPALLGMWRPKLLLPRSMVHTFTKRQLRHVFLHELAHLKRHDIAASCVASVCHLIHWFNPLVWYAFQLMRTDRELACDQVALGQLSRSEASTLYGQTIIRILEFNRCHPLRAAIAGMGQTRHQVRKRIVSIAEFRPSCEGIQWGAACLLACLAVTGLTRTPITDAPRTPHPASETVLAQETSPKAPVFVNGPTPIHTVAQESATDQAPAVSAQEDSPEQHPFMLSQEYTVSPPQLQQSDSSHNVVAGNAQMWSQYHYQVQAQLNARQMQMAQNSFIRQQRRTASATASRRRKRPTQNGIPGIVEMAARQNALNRRTQ